MIKSYHFAKKLPIFRNTFVQTTFMVVFYNALTH